MADLKPKVFLFVLCCSLFSSVSLAASEWQRHPDNPVLIPGYDVAIAFNDPSVFYDEDEKKWKMWVGTAWGETKEKHAKVGVRYAESTDGIHWKIQAEMALEPSEDPNAFDYTNAETPAVIKNPNALPERRYLMFYSGGSVAKFTWNGFPMYRIGLAFSADGKKFTRLPASESPHGQDGFLFDINQAFPSNTDLKKGAISDPEALLLNGKIHLWFAAFALNSADFPVVSGTGYAVSENGIDWKASAKNPLSSLARPESPSGPAQSTVIWNPTKQMFEMWYTDHTPEEEKQLTDNNQALGFWYAYSQNGEDWTTTYGQDRDFARDSTLASESTALTTGAEVVMTNGTYRLYYGSWGNKKTPVGWPEPVIWAINVAERSIS